MKRTPWDDIIVDRIKTVNRSLHKGGELTKKAESMLYDIECCLCSGDGLSPSSAFIAKNQWVAERVLDLMGLSGHPAKTAGGCERMDLERNMYSLERLWFKINTDTKE